MVSETTRTQRSLIPAAAALNAKDRAALVKSLESLVGQHSGKGESPKLKKSVAALTKLQDQLKNLNKKFVERAALKARQNRSREEGRNFWLYLLKSNEVLAKEITKRDEEALKDLEDIKCSRMTEDSKPILEKATRNGIQGKLWVRNVLASSTSFSPSRLQMADIFW